MPNSHEPLAGHTALSLFSGKTTPPRLPVDAVHRPRLQQLIRERDPQLLVVSAPVGFGKSTALAQIHADWGQRGMPVAWLTLDERDNDLSRFLLYLREAALHLGCPGVPSPADVSTSPEMRTQLERHAQALVDALARRDGPWLLVLDEFENICNPAVLSVVQAIGNQVRPGSCLAIGSRTVPPLRLASWRAQCRLHQISAAQLRFDAGETVGFLERQANLILDRALQRLLHERTDGWPAAVRLAALALDGVEDAERWLATLTGGNNDITEYMVENVFAQQTARRREFLLASSVMETFDARACDALLERNDCADEIDAICQANLFLTPIDAQGRWFRYHAMFREFLLRQLEQQQPGALRLWRRRAATWFARQKRYPLAMPLALDSGDMDLAASILNECAFDLVRSAWLSTLEQWMEPLPPDVYQGRRQLMRARAYTMIAVHRHADALQALEALRHGGDAADVWEIDVQIALLHSWMDRQSEVLALRDRLRERYGVGDQQDLLTRGIFCNIMIYTHCFSHDVTGARSWLPAAKECVEQRPEAWSSTYTLCFEGMLDLIEGYPSDALQRLEVATSQASGGGLAAAAAYRVTAMYEADQLTQAQTLVEHSLDEIKRSGAPDVLAMAVCTLARIRYHRARESCEHVELLNDLIDLAEARQLPRVKAAALLDKSHLALLDGDVEAAWGYFTQGSAEILWDQVRGLRLFAQEIADVPIAAARLAIASGQGATVIDQLESMVQQAHAQKRRWRRLRLQCLLAQALSQARRRTQALAVLEEALLGIRVGGFVRVLADEPWGLQDLLSELGSRSRRLDAALLATLEQACLATGARFCLARPAAINEGRLTSKELEVLRLASTGCANKIIASKLGITDNTVETHLRRVNT